MLLVRFWELSLRRSRQKFVSEYDPQFWGFDTQEEWDAAWEAIGKECKDRFYSNVLNYVSNQPNDIGPGTIGEIKAKIAKQLVEADLTLILPESRERLMKKVEEIYRCDHSVTIRLTEREVALVRMMATHDSDLPQA
jgi:hypothetical protein